MKKIHYVPAGFEQVFSDPEINLIKNLETEYVLVNYLTFKSQPPEFWKKFSDIIHKENKKIIMDSGGFQLIANPKLNINPKDVFNYQSELSDMGFILDVPLFELKNINGTDSMIPVINNVDVNERMNKTLKNINEIKMLDKKGSELFLIIHGNNPKEYNDWFELTKESAMFDGVSLKTKTIPQFVMSFFTVYRHGYKKYHALGTSALSIIPLFYYVFSKTNFERVTYDSSNSLQYSVNKRMLLEILYLKDKCLHITEMSAKKTICKCKMCEAIDYNIDEYKGVGFAKTNYSPNYYSCALTIHNSNIMNRYNDLVTMLSENPEELKEWASTRFPKTKIWYEIIDKCFEECNNSPEPFYKIFDEKLKKYHEYFNISNNETVQSNVMKWF